MRIHIYSITTTNIKRMRMKSSSLISVSHW